MMDLNNALIVLIKAAHRGQEKGIFTLSEAATIHEAISVFTVKQGDSGSEQSSTDADTGSSETEAAAQEASTPTI